MIMFIDLFYKGLLPLILKIKSIFPRFMNSKTTYQSLPPLLYVLDFGVSLLREKHRVRP